VLMAGGGRRLTGGSHESVRGSEKGCTGSVCLLDGPRARSPVGLKGFPGSISIFISSFLFFFFCFLISFLEFAKLLQINSNHFQKFCKIQGKVLNQQQTCFQNQNRFLLKDLN
jgi:hypothetical protein